MVVMTSLLLMLPSLVKLDLINEQDDEKKNENSSDLCPNKSDNDHLAKLCKFWIQGVLLTLIGFCGIIGNLVSVFVLTKPCMLSTFNLILAFMTINDTLFLISSIVEYSLVESFELTSLTYDKIFVYLLYPIHNVTLVSSVFLHVVLAFERYLAVCHPQKVYSNQRRSTASGGAAGGGNMSQQLSKQAANAIKKKVTVFRIGLFLCTKVQFPILFRVG